MRTAALGAGLLLCTAWSPAKENKVKMADLPPAVQKTVKEMAKDATLLGLSVEVENGRTLYEAEMKMKGRSRDVTINPDGTVLEVEEAVPLAEVPEAARATIQRIAGKGKILRVESVSRRGAVVAYEAEIRPPRQRVFEIRVDPEGRPAPPK